MLLWLLKKAATSMYMQKKQKMCWNCEGNVSVEALYCPFCGSDLHVHEKAKEHATATYRTTPQEAHNLSSLYKPPYQPTHSGYGVPSYHEEPVEEVVEEANSDYFYPNTPDEPVYPKEHIPVNTGYEEIEEEIKKPVDVGIWPLLFLSVGANLMTLGLLLFFFSDSGRVILEWNSYFWFVYCILSTPLLMFGWKLLQAQSKGETTEE